MTGGCAPRPWMGKASAATRLVPLSTLKLCGCQRCPPRPVTSDKRLQCWAARHVGARLQPLDAPQLMATVICHANLEGYSFFCLPWPIHPPRLVFHGSYSCKWWSWHWTPAMFSTRKLPVRAHVSPNPLLLGPDTSPQECQVVTNGPILSNCGSQARSMWPAPVSG